jgi:hypothetical protein
MKGKLTYERPRSGGLSSKFLGFYALFFALVTLGFSTKTEATELTLSCEKQSLSGMFEQCEEIVIIEKLGQRVRAYSKPKKIVLSLRAESVFIARNLSPSEKITSNQRITISADRLWNTSKPGFQSLCEVQSESKNNNLLRVNCGHYKNQTVARSAVFVLHPFVMANSVKEKPRNGDALSFGVESLHDLNRSLVR